ncbi:hypothetical protein EV715DRAFT_214652 [Schizophyllum commune]
MAAVGPPPGVVGARDVFQALQSAGRAQEHPADTARQRFAHARRVLETIKHDLNDASAALALAEGQLAIANPPSSRYDGASGVNGQVLIPDTSSSALVAVHPGPWAPTYVSTVGWPLSTGDQDQQLGDVPADALIASRPASRHGCARHHTSHSSQDALIKEPVPLGFTELQDRLSITNNAQDHVALDECSLVRLAHIRKDGTTHHHAHHSLGLPSPSRITAFDDDRRHLSASQDGRSYDAEGQAHDEHVTARNNAQTQHSTGTSACGAYGTGARGPLDLDQEAARLPEQGESRLRKQQELRQQVWEAKKRALEAEAARVREARAATGPISNSEGQLLSSGAEEEAGLPPSLSRRSTSSARRHSSPAPPRRLVDRIEAPRLVDRIAPRRASLADRIEPLPLADHGSQPSPPTSHPIPLIDRIERTPCASPWRSPTPSLDGSSSASVDEFEDPPTGDSEDATADVYNGISTPVVQSPSPLILSPTPRASSSAAYDASGLAYDGASTWSEVDEIIREAIQKSPSNDAHRAFEDAHRTPDDVHRTRYNADQTGWTPASPASSVDSAITRGVEAMAVDDGEETSAEDVGKEIAVDGGKGVTVGNREQEVDGDEYDGEMPMEISEDEGDGEDDTQNAPEEPPATPTEPGSPTLTKLLFFEGVPSDEPSPPSSPAPSSVENRTGSPYASRVQGLLESTSKPTWGSSAPANGTFAGKTLLPSSNIARANASSGFDTPATLDYQELPSPPALPPPSSIAQAGPASPLTKPSASTAPRPRIPSARSKAPAHSKLYKKARRNLAKSTSSATARDIKSSINRPPATNLTVGARLVAASAPPPGQVVTFAQLGAGYRLTSAALEAAEGISESVGDEDSSESDLDSLFDEIPEDEFDAESSQSFEHPNSSDPRLFRQHFGIYDPQRRTVMEDARSDEMHATMKALALQEDSASHEEPPLLPVELVEEIVAQLPYRSAILKKCCLVARSWVTPCRARLFAHLSLYPRAYPSGLLDLSESDLALTAPPTIRHQLIALLAMPAAFATAPDIPQYVRGLSVQMMRLATPSDRAAAAEAAVQVLQLFPRLHTLTLDARALDYPDFSPALQSALCDILAQPGLTSLHLREQDVTDAGVHALLRSARHLRRLSIWPRPLLYVRLDGEDVPALPAGAPRPQLHTLHLVGPFDAALAWASAPHCPLDLRALRTLSLSPRRAFDMGGAFARFAAAHGAGVRTLVVSLCDVWSVVGNDVGAAAGLAFLDHMPALRIIRVKDGVLAPWSLVCAVRLLEVAVRKTGVEVFELRVAIWPADADSYRRKEIHLDHWREVDSRLAAVREESSLRRMDFVAVPDEEASQADAERLQNWVEYALPNFAAGGRDILHFSAVDGGMPWDETTAWDRGTVWADTD